jgi:hypothetical protein
MAVKISRQYSKNTAATWSYNRKNRASSAFLLVTELEFQVTIRKL